MADEIIIQTASQEVIEVGVVGPQGPAGTAGAAGPANSLSIGTVTSGANASATITGAAPSQTLSLVLPKGDKGDKGDPGSGGASTWDEVANKPATFPPSAHAASHAAGIRAQFSGQVAGMTSNAIIRANNAGSSGNSITLSFSGATKGTFTGQVAGMTTNVTIRALGFGTSGNVALSFNGSDTIQDAITNDGTVELVSGDGTQIPDNGEEISLTGGGGSIADAVGAWNSANPSNQATIFAGGSQGPNNGTSITLSGGVASGSDPISDPAFNSIGVGVAAPQSAGQLLAIRTEESGQDSLLKAISTANTTSADTNWRGRIMNGAENRTFLMGCYLGEAGLGAHNWISAKNETGAAWSDFLINPDGGADVFIGCQTWDKTKAILKVGNSDGKVTISDKTSPTKKFNFDVSEVTAGQTRSLSVPNASGKIIVSASTPDDGDTLVWDDTTGAWVASAPSGGGGSGVTDGDKGDITVSASGATWIIDNNAVTNAKLAQVATSTLKGRATTGTGNVEDLTASQVRTILNVADGATANSADGTLLNRANHTGTQTASTISDFNTAAAAAAPVQSVAGRTGTVTLAKADVGLGNVDNTSDANKPISTATQTALDGKAATSHSHAISDVTGLQTALDGKQATGSYASATHAHAAADITSGTLTHERGGLEADVSAYNGLVKISGGATSAVTVTATGESVIGAADAAAARSAISAAAASHTHELTALAATGATNGHVLTANGSGGVTFAAASGGGSGGTKTYAVFTATDNNPPATDFATIDQRNSVACLDFSDTATESAVFVGVMPEGAVLTSGLIVRLHWMGTATTGNVRWSVAFERGNTDLDTDSFDTATAATATTNGTSGIVTVTAITCTSIDSIAAGDLFRLRVQRLGADAADSMTGAKGCELVAVEIRSAA